MTTDTLPRITGQELLIVIVDDSLHTSLSLGTPAVWFIVALVLIACVTRLLPSLIRRSKHLTIDQAQLGLAGQTITLRPNDTDRQIAYKLWVELSTRKIGLPIDLRDDIVLEIYDSWHAFFSVTRELLKDVPVSKFQRRTTRQIVTLSLEILNTAIRPHLTTWQARFRHWYSSRTAHVDDHPSSPQQIQRSFPEYDALKKDLDLVNRRLVLYREKMYDLASNG